jgi:hypothetical protein
MRQAQTEGESLGMSSFSRMTIWASAVAIDEQLSQELDAPPRVVQYVFWQARQVFVRTGGGRLRLCVSALVVCWASSAGPTYGMAWIFGSLMGLRGVQIVRLQDYVLIVNILLPVWLHSLCHGVRLTHRIRWHPKLLIWDCWGLSEAL